MAMCYLCDLCACYWRYCSHSTLYDNKIRCSGRNLVIDYGRDDPLEICKHFEPECKHFEPKEGGDGIPD